MAANVSLLDKLDGLEARFQEVSLLITDPSVIADMKRFVKLNREYRDLEPVVAARQEYIKLQDSIAEARELMVTESDPEMRQMAREELDSATVRLPQLEEEIKQMLIPADPQDDKDVIMEIRGGTGGDEAAILQGTCSACTASIASHAAGRQQYHPAQKAHQVDSRRSYSL